MEQRNENKRKGGGRTGGASVTDGEPRPSITTGPEEAKKTKKRSSERARTSNNDERQSMSPWASEVKGEERKGQSQ